MIYWIITLTILLVLTLIWNYTYYKKNKQLNKTTDNLLAKQDIDREVCNHIGKIMESQEKEIEWLENEKIVSDRKIKYRNRRITKLEILLSEATWDKKHLRGRKLTK